MCGLLIAGGDERFLQLAKLLRADGYQVQTLGLGEEKQEFAEKADGVLLPYPFSMKDEHIPNRENVEIGWQDVLPLLHEEAFSIVGAGLKDEQTQALGKVMRYTDAESFVRQNAQLSAEAAVFEVMKRSSLALMDMKILITGYGLFGRALALKLRALGVDVWIAVRRKAQKLQAQIDGMHGLLLGEMPVVLGHVHTVLNTVPAPILTKEHLEQLSKETWLLELASAPYGFDTEEAAALGLKCDVLPGLPARYAPQSAGLALYRAVKELFGRCEK